MLASAALAVLASAPAANARSLHALVIGIDAYAHEKPLLGAVADARDIADALNGLGIRPTVLLDRSANRSAVEREWRTLLGRAVAGDTILLTYAGHGSRRFNPRTVGEADGADDLWLLPGFDQNDPGNREFVLDDDLNAWFRDAARKQVRVVLVSDSCHSGTMYRDADARAGEIGIRYSPSFAATEGPAADPEPPAWREPAGGEPAELATLTAYSAGLESETVPEVAVPGPDGRVTMRGALSHAFGRALRGEADNDRNGVLTRRELDVFVRQIVRELSGSAQHPDVWPPFTADTPVIPIGTAMPPLAREKLRDSVRVRVIGDRGALASEIPSARIVDGAADLVWDVSRRQVVDARGDMVAERIDADGLGGVIDKVNALRSLIAARRLDPVTLRVEPGDGIHREGGPGVQLVVEDLRGGHLTLFGIAGNGVVQFLYPTEPEDASAPVEAEYYLPTVYRDAAVRRGSRRRGRDRAGAPGTARAAPGPARDGGADRGDPRRARTGAGRPDRHPRAVHRPPPLRPGYSSRAFSRCTSPDILAVSRWSMAWRSFGKSTSSSWWTWPSISRLSSPARVRHRGSSLGICSRA